MSLRIWFIKILILNKLLAYFNSLYLLNSIQIQINQFKMDLLCNLFYLIIVLKGQLY